MKKIFPILSFVLLSLPAFSQPGGVTITSTSTQVIVTTPASSKSMPICDFNWAITSGGAAGVADDNLRIWQTDSRDPIPSGQLRFFTIDGVTDNNLKDEALGAITSQCDPGSGGADTLYTPAGLPLVNGDTIPSPTDAQIPLADTIDFGGVEVDTLREALLAIDARLDTAIAGDGNGIISALPLANVSIDANSNDLKIGELDSLYLRANKLVIVDSTSSDRTVFDFKSITAPQWSTELKTYGEGLMLTKIENCATCQGVILIEQARENVTTGAKESIASGDKIGSFFWFPRIGTGNDFSAEILATNTGILGNEGGSEMSLKTKTTADANSISRLVLSDTGRVSVTKNLRLTPLAALPMVQQNGDMFYANYTDGTYTSKGLWYREEGVVKKLAGSTDLGNYVLKAGDVMTGNLLMTSNKIIGGSTTTSDLNLQTTSGVGTTGADMHFLVGNAGATEAMTILNSGNVGIGTTNPGAKLEIKGSGTTTAGFIFGGGAATSAYLGIGRNGTVEGIFGISGGVGNFLNGAASGDIIIGAASSKNILFGNTETGTTEYMRILSTGNVGIGTTSPDRLLHPELADATFATVTYPFRISKITSGTATTNFGLGVEYELENASGTNRVAATEEVAWSDAVDLTEDATYTLKLIKAGTLTTGMTVSSIGTLTVPTHLVAGGDVTAGTTGGLKWNGVGEMKASSNGVVALYNSANTDFNRLQFGGTTNSFNAIARDAVNGFTLQSAAATATWNDASTAASGTVANRYLFGIAAPTLSSTNAMTNTVASTVYIGGAPAAGTNTTIGTAYALFVEAGNSLFNGNIENRATVVFSGTTTSSGAGAVGITGSIHEITTTGTGDALSLANGVEGQRLTVIYVAEGAGTDTAVITPTNFGSGSTITFSAPGQSVRLIFTNGKWYVDGSPFGAVIV